MVAHKLLVLVVAVAVAFLVGTESFEFNVKKALWKVVSNKARQQIIDRGASIGVSWEDNTRALMGELDTLQLEYDAVLDKNLIYPEYYLKPFHAYDEGNLSWQCAVEVKSAAYSVHSPIFAGSNNKVFKRDGDWTLRNNFHDKMKMAFSEQFFEPKKVVDIGCSTGLSTLKLAESFPSAEIIGADLSPYMLSVANYERGQLTDDEGRDRISYVHAAGESLPFTAQDKVDLYSMCLTAHELPEGSSREIFQQIFEKLPSGGAVSFMDIGTVVCTHPANRYPVSISN